MAGAPLLSIVIPAHNEEARLPGTLEQIVAYLGRQDYAAEVLVVENGSRDGTWELAQGWSRRHGFLRALRCEQRGKGAAVRHGMLLARGEYRFICDADLSMPIDELAKFLPPARADYDVAIGSRNLPASQLEDFPLRRRLVSRCFNLLVRSYLLPGLSDTQCGFKCFRGPRAHAIFRRQRLDGFAFDVETLVIARRWGLAIAEVPIRWRFEPNSRVSLLRDARRMAADLRRIKSYAARGLYAPPTAAELAGGLDVQRQD